MLESQGSPKNHWDRQHGQQGEPWIEQEHGPANGHHGGDQLQDVVGAVVEETLELVDVVIEYRHQPAAAALLKEAQVQPLQVVVGA